MAAGIEEHIALRMTQQMTDHRQIDGFITRGIGKVNAFAHSQSATGQHMPFHRVPSLLRGRLVASIAPSRLPTAAIIIAP